MTGPIEDAPTDVIVAARNAQSTTVASPLVEPAIRLEPSMLDGDACFADGNIARPNRSYADAVTSFADEDEPDVELAPLRLRTSWPACAARPGSTLGTRWLQSAGRAQP